MAKPVPEGCRTITPYIVVKDGARALDFYKRAFGATERFRTATPDGRIGHAEMQIGDSLFMLSDEFSGSNCKSPQSLGGTTFSFWLYVEDVDASFKKATQAGATEKMPVGDMFWGDRLGQVVDPFGHMWSIATHKEDVSQDELQKRAAEAMAKMAQSAKS